MYCARHSVVFTSVSAVNISHIMADRANLDPYRSHELYNVVGGQDEPLVEIELADLNQTQNFRLQRKINSEGASIRSPEFAGHSCADKLP